MLFIISISSISGINSSSSSGGGGGGEVTGHVQHISHLPGTLRRVLLSIVVLKQHAGPERSKKGAAIKQHTTAPGAVVQPHDCIVQRLPAAAAPDPRRLTLVGDTKSNNLKQHVRKQQQGQGGLQD